MTIAANNHALPRYEPIARARFLELEGLRGVLALLVCTYHLGLNTALERVGAHVRGSLAVDMFFALSGFVLCHTYYLGKRSARDFVAGRIARLYPLHLLTLLVMVWTTPRTGKTLDVDDLWQQILTVHNIGLPPYTHGLNMPAWSISVEIWVSVAFFLLLTRWRTWSLLACVAIPIALGLDLGEHGEAETINGVNAGILRGVAGFAVGAMAYRVHESINVDAPRESAYAAIALLSLFFVLPSWSIASNVMFYATAFAVLIVLAAGRTVLSSRTLVSLGAWSYSVYLLHMPLYYLATMALGERFTRGAGKFALIPAIVLVSWACYHWFERPIQRAILRLATRNARGAPR